MSIHSEQNNREATPARLLKKRKNREPWRRRALELVAWILMHMVNRDDCYLQYLPTIERSKKRKVETIHGTLSQAILHRHCCGHDGDLVGIHAISPENTCRWIALDLDNHGDDAGVGEANQRIAIEIYLQLKAYGFNPLLLSSDGNGGYHLLVLFSTPVASEIAYRFAQWLVQDWQEQGLDQKPETFPKQLRLTKRSSYGNALRLPGRHHTRDHYTGIWDGQQWLSGDKAIDAILAIQPSPQGLIPLEALVQEGTKSSRSSVGCFGDTFSLPETKNTNTTRILRRLDNVQSSGDGWSARCPSHGDRNNSLSVGESSDGQVLIYCHAGCGIEAIVEDLGISMSDLFPKQSIRTRRTIAGGIRTRANRGES